MKEAQDKCQICGYVGRESEFEKAYEEIYEGYGIICPNCGSFDVDDSEYDPYLDEDFEDDFIL